MFYLYDTLGVRFRGTMEQLELEHKVAKMSRTNEFSNVLEALEIEETHDKHNLGKNKGDLTNPYTLEEKKGQIEPLVHAYQIMSHPVIHVGENTSIEDCWKILNHANIRYLPVISSTNEILGVVSDRMILTKLNVEGDIITVSSQQPIKSLINEKVISSAPTTDIRQMARIMVLYNKGAMPVIEDEGYIIGIVTRYDILKGFIDHQRLNLWG